MKKFTILYFLFSILCLPAFPEQEQILFILDFSNSMNETLNGVPKIELMMNTMREILPTISPDTPVGLRVYGHKGGFTAFEGCHASSLLTPVMPFGAKSIEDNLLKVKPRGMTPITYSLKQAVQKDFLGFTGKKRIILLTDGGENCDESPCKYAMELIKTRHDIVIDVIAFAIQNSDDLEQLQCAALVTRGKFYNAQTAAELARSMRNSVYKDVEAKILY
jgi:Ca-activated chloride channel family protein